MRYRQRLLLLHERIRPAVLRGADVVLEELPARPQRQPRLRLQRDAPHDRPMPAEPLLQQHPGREQRGLLLRSTMNALLDGRERSDVKLSRLVVGFALLALLALFGLVVLASCTIFDGSIARPANGDAAACSLAKPPLARPDALDDGGVELFAVGRTLHFSDARIG